MDRKLLLRRIRTIWVSAGLGLTVVFVAWSLLAYRASSDAAAAVVGDSTVVVEHGDGVWRFTPARRTDSTEARFLFFPGALVDPVAYAPLARAVAVAGMPAVIVELPRRGALGGANDPSVFARAVAEMRSAGRSARWVVAGHSRGAVVATSFVSQHRADVAGLVLMGTTHPRDVDLSSLEFPVLKVVATNDRIAPAARSEANRHLLPAATRWVRLEGGNHSQFGWYGFQPLDGFADMPRQQQHAELIAAVLAFLSELRMSS